MVYLAAWKVERRKTPCLVKKKNEKEDFLIAYKKSFLKKKYINLQTNKTSKKKKKLKQTNTKRVKCVISHLPQFLLHFPPKLGRLIFNGSREKTFKTRQNHHFPLPTKQPKLPFSPLYIFLSPFPSFPKSPQPNGYQMRFSLSTPSFNNWEIDL